MIKKSKSSSKKNDIKTKKSIKKANKILNKKVNPKKKVKTRSKRTINKKSIMSDNCSAVCCASGYEPACVPVDSRGIECVGCKKISITLVYLVVFLSIFFMFFYVPVNINSPAMEPSIMQGDYILVSKFSHGYSKYSFPIRFSIRGRIFGRKPVRGELIAFKTIRGNVSIQRIVGLPGDRIKMEDSILYLNSMPVSRGFLDNYLHNTKFNKELGLDTKKVSAEFVELLPGGIFYRVLDTQDDAMADNTASYIVPKGHYFVIGDNRDDSLDSRFSNIGFVSLEEIIGQPKIVLFSLSEYTFKFWEWPFIIRWPRMFHMLH